MIAPATKQKVIDSIDLNTKNISALDIIISSFAGLW